MKSVLQDAQFLSTLCHDLRGPLGGLTTWIHVLSSGGERPETQAQALAAMMRSVQTQVALIDQLSEFAALLEAQPDPMETPVELLPIVWSVIAGLGDISRVQVRLEGSEPVLAFSERRLTWILRQLLTCGFSSPPGTAIEVLVDTTGDDLALVLEAPGKPRAMGIVLARALLEDEDGACSLDAHEAAGRATLMVHLPLHR
jgi:signal transduction histidine kinase